MHTLRYLACILLIVFHLNAEPKKITVAGTGLTGLWAAYSVCRDLEDAGCGKDATITIIGKWDWTSVLDAAAGQKTTIFSHEASGFGPMGIQPHSGLVWNTDNEVVGLVKKGIGHPEAAFYTAPNLEEAGREFLDLYVG